MNKSVLSNNQIPSEGLKIDRYNMIYLVFIGIFVAFMVLTNTVGVKLFQVQGIKIFGGNLILPVSIVWYPLTFLITDIVSEMYGAKHARILVIMGFTMSLLLLAFAFIGIGLPLAEGPYTGLPFDFQVAYTAIFGLAWRLLLGSMAAYLLAQFVDVHLFHFWKRATGGKHLWLRNNGSTMISQIIDSFTVNFIFLYKNDTFNLDFWDVASISLASYIVKVLIAALDTPFCYLGVAFVERATGVKGKDIA